MMLSLCEAPTTDQSNNSEQPLHSVFFFLLEPRLAQLGRIPLDVS